MTADVIRYPAYKRITSAIVLALAGFWMVYLLLWPSSGKATGAGVPIGSPAPDFTLQTIDGKTYTLSELKGKVVMINFWATWCTACRREMPALQAAYEELKSQDFVILAVNLDESDLAIKSFQEKLGLTFPIVVDKGNRVTKLYDIIPLPTSYFVDKNGIVRSVWKGELRKDQLTDIVKKLL